MHISTTVAPTVRAARLVATPLPVATLAAGNTALALAHLQARSHALFDATTATYNAHLSSIANFADTVCALDTRLAEELRRD